MRIDCCFETNHGFSQYFSGATNIKAHKAVSARAKSWAWI